MQSHFRRALLALAIATLTACGGGGSSGSGEELGRNTEEPSNHDIELLSLELEKGLYWMQMGTGEITDTQTYTNTAVFLARTRMSIVDGHFRTEYNWIYQGSWVSEDDFIFLPQPSSNLALTASGWQDRNSAPCTVDDSPSGATLNCVGTQHLIDLEPVADLSTTSLADTFTQIAKTDLADLEDAFQAVVAATAGLTSLLDASARSYQFTSTTQTDSVITSSCQPATPDQPAAEWTCDDGFTSTSWEELALNGDMFWFGSVLPARLDGDPDNGKFGTIAVVDFPFLPEGLEPGTVIGTWEKISVNSQSIIRLIGPEGLDLSDHNALAIVNGRIVQAGYQPAGEQISALVYNAEAAAALSNAAIGIFPLILEPELLPQG